MNPVRLSNQSQAFPVNKVITVRSPAASQHILDSAGCNLAFQIRQNTRSVRSATAQSASHDIVDMNSLLVGDRAVAELIFSGSVKPEELDPVDEMRFVFAISSNFVTFETMLLQQRSGLIDAEFWESRERFLLSSPGVVSWWRRSSELYGDQFRQYVDSQIR